ncbi:MAG: amino acid adenylation domain-containing protein [Cyanobacteria bacterium P01_A01_bin.135]
MSQPIANLTTEQKRQLLSQLLQKKAQQSRRALLSSAQQRLWFIEQLQPETSVYVIPAVLRLEGALQVEALQRSLEAIARRHDILRTCFVAEAGQPYQQVAASVELPLPVLEMSQASESAVQAQIQQAIAAPFDLAQAPLLRCQLIQLASQQHLLVVAIHHIVADYWSLRVLMTEIAALYPALAQGQSPQLPKLAIQYADYATWQRQQLSEEEQSSRLAQQLAYWKQQLNGPPPLLELPTDFPRPPVQTFRGARQSFALSPQLSATLQTLAKRHQATLFMTLLAAFQALLHRYSQQQDIWVGSTVTNRDRRETQNLIGLFVNNLVFRTRLSGELPFQDLLQQVRETALDAYASQDVPFEAIVDALSVERHLSHNALFQVMFILHNTPSQTLTLPGLSITAQEPEAGTARFDLSLDMYETADGLTGVFEYNTDLFKVTTIQRLIGHFETLLAGVTADPQQPIGALPLLTEKEHQLIEGWNQTEQPVPEQCVHELIAAQATERPEAIAVVFEDVSLSYEELDRRVSELAEYLQQQGVKPGDRVAFCLERSPLLVVVMLAILKVGAAYVPLDPAYPAERLRFILGDAQVSLLLHDGNLPLDGDGVAAIDVSGIGLDGDRISDIDLPPVQAQHAVPLPSLPVSNGDDAAIAPDGIAYLIYTSGSTGTPKGVPIRHHSLTNLLTSMAQAPGMGSSDTLLAVTTPAFDIAALELLLPLTVGGTLVIASQEATRDPQQLTQQIERQDVTLMQATPATWRLLVESGWQGQPDLKLLCGGEALDIALAQELTGRGELWNLYGPTETTIWSAALKIEPSTIKDGIVPIGRAIANTSFHVLDEQNRPVPIGAAGELHIGGAGLSHGYWNRPDLTADRFIAIPSPMRANDATPVRAFAQRGRSPYGRSPLPIAPFPHSPTLYKTGDRVRQREDGTLEYLGRLDHQIKLRGYRIELGEIEAALVQQPEVKQAVVVLRDEQLVAYIITEASAAELSTTERIGRLRQRLPSYMVPARFVVLDALPLTPNGKVNRKALPDPEPTGTAEGATAPATPTEELLAKIWSTVLSQSSISREDNFFELGGHSLLATRVVAQVRQAFSVELPLRTLFEQPVLSQMAIAIDRLKASELAIADPIEPIDRSGELPLSDAQQRQWVLAQLEPDSPFYNIPAAVNVSGELSVATLEQALNHLMQRHEVLRTAFKDAEGKAQLEICAEGEVSIPIVDLRGLDQSDQDKQVRQHLRAVAQTPFVLSQAPLLRLQILRLAVDEHVIMLCSHHIIADGWSMGLLVRELAQSYQALRSRQPVTLPPLPLQYVDYAAWQQSQNQKQGLDYWRSQLQGAPPLLELPTDHSRPAVQTFEGGTYSFRLSSKQAQALEQLAQRQGVTLFMVLLAVFQVLLYRYSGATDLLIGTPIANRPRTELEGILGMFVNTLVLRTDLSDNPSFEVLLERAKGVALDAYAHQSVPFEQVVDALEVPRSWSHAPLFQVMLVLENASAEAIALPELEWQPLGLESGTAKFDLTLSMRQDGQGLTGQLEYRKDLFSADTIHRMAGHLRQLLRVVPEAIATPIAELPMLTNAEHKQLQQWNQTQADYPNLCLHELFEQQVKASPDAAALIFGEQRLSYRQLNAQADQLAHHLRSLGVGPEALVGVCMARSADMVVGLLAILKAGGAYVPLDPAYPAERLAFIAEDACISVLLCDGDMPFDGDRITVINPSAVRATGDSMAASDSGDHITAINPSAPVRATGHTGYAHATQTPLPSSPPPTSPVPLLDGDHPESRPAIAPDITPHNLAYVIYTSGSTGRPKGVAIGHRSPVALCHWAKDVFSAQQLSGVLAGTSICFDLSVFELFVPLSWGGTVILAEDVLQLPELAAGNQVTLVNTVPSAATALLRTGGLPPSVTTVNLAGEPLPPSLVQQLYQTGHIQQVYNLYGPSEDTTYSTYARMDAREAIAPIGRPIANTQGHVLDEAMRPVPMGVPGELYLGGAGIARGYLNRPELTAERFLPNPFHVGACGGTPDSVSGSDGQMGIRLYAPTDVNGVLYKTGDRVRLRYDGTLEYLGRLDNQVKIRGFRIELGEIEAALLSHPGINQVAVNPWTDGDGNRRLVAYVVWRAVPEDAPSLSQFLAGKLPDYMLPAASVTLEALPHLPNGKLDRKALPVPELTGQAEGEMTEREAALAAIWTALLPVDQVGRHDNFFTLGGDSILALQTIAKAHQAGLQLTPRDLFQHQTIAELAAIAPRQVAQAEQSVITGPVPLTPIQRWFFAQGLSHPYHWNQAVLLEVRRALDPARLERALGQVLEHHDALRAVFNQSGAGWQQQFQPPGPVPFTAITGKASELAAAIATTANDLQSSFDLATGPLLKVAYFDFEGDCRLLLVSHHLVIDGVSWRILLADLRLAYEQAHEQSTTLPPKTTSLKQWAKRLNAHATSEALQAERAYWQSVAAVPAPALPRDFDPDEAANLMQTADQITVTLDETNTRRLLQEVPAAYAVQINDLLLTALVLAFEPWTGARRLRLELEGHGREELPGELAEVNLSRTVGWLTTLFPVALDLTDAPDLGMALKRVKETLRAVPNQGLGYGVGRYLSSEGLPSAAAEVRFNYFGQLDQTFTAEDWLAPASEATGAARSSLDPRTTLLELDGLVSRGQLRLIWTYSTALHRRDTIARLADQFLTALRQLIDHCLTNEDTGYTPSDFPHMGLDQGELDDLLAEL